MKTALLLAALAGLVLVATPAEAQQSSSLIVMMNVPEQPLTAEQPRITFSGMIDYTADLTTYTSLSGIPVTYTVTKAPAWASVIISPATDIIPLPSTPSFMFMASRPFTVIVDVGSNVTGELVDQIEVTATTTPGSFGKAATGKSAVPIRLDVAQDEPCDAAHPLAEPEAQPAAAEPAPEVQVQSGSVTPLSTRWLVIAGFGLVGAGVGLVLRRRL